MNEDMSAATRKMLDTVDALCEDHEAALEALRLEHRMRWLTVCEALGIFKEYESRTPKLEEALDAIKRLKEKAATLSEVTKLLRDDDIGLEELKLLLDEGLHFSDARDAEGSR